MLPYRDSRLTTFAILAFFLIAFGYTYFEARGILFGPSISVPPGTTEVHDSLIMIKGHAERISSLTMNGSPIAVTEKGDFSESYLLAPGDNKIFLDATDKYNRSTRKVIEIVYTPNATSTPTVSDQMATSTASASSTGTLAH